MVIAVDMDGVLVALNRRHIERLNERNGTSYKYEDITAFDYRKAGFTQSESDQLWDMWNEPDLYDNVIPEHGAIWGLGTLRDRHRVIAASSPLIGSIESKARWLRDVAGFAASDVMLGRDKSLLRADLLLDDGVHNLESFPGLTLCFTRPWNSEWTGPRAYNWWSVPPWVETLLDERARATAGAL
jgi:5'(3')-deoxyribonucleotidase